MSSTLSAKIAKAINNPGLALNVVKSKVSKKFQRKVFVSERSHRSESDNGSYVAFVERAAQDYRVFNNFRRHPSYQAIVENVTKEDGLRYWKEILVQSPSFLDLSDKCKANDLIGNPYTHVYPQIGRISPTTLRYMKVASDLQRYFGLDIGKKIAEIGVGYGGQLLVNDKLFNLSEYHLFDLPPVLNLVSKYLENHLLSCSYKTTTLNQSSGADLYDIVISNYAFSELPSQLQRRYIDKVLSKSRKGYLTMNSGRDNSAFTNNKLSITDLRDMLPPFEVIDENPKTSPNNYVIIWGHSHNGGSPTSVR